MVDRAVPADSERAHLRVRARDRGAQPVGYARRRFIRHRLAVASVVVLAGIFGAGIFANYIAPYSYKEIPYVTIAGTSVIDTSQILAHPSRQHLFGTDSAGRDYLQPHALWHPHIRARRDLRRPAFDADRHDHRRPRRLLRRLDATTC